ncbi:hypothetical protein FHG87_024991 [Trinorchestia longiramus]|nr:hypothetical protein FHG87_024991 [Trinorchestia longiramus]
MQNVSGSKGYRLYDFNAKRILLSRDVVFNECEFMSFEKDVKRMVSLYEPIISISLNSLLNSTCITI